MKKYQANAYITVYLSLTIVVMLSFILTLLEGVRMQTIRFQTECVMDMGLNSIFAEYNREMLDQYGLLFIDASYGSDEFNTAKTKSHLLQYMNMNFSPSEMEELADYKNLTAIHADNAEFIRAAYASDHSAEVLNYQIVRFMELKKGLSYIKQYIPDMKYAEEENKADEYENKRIQNDKRIESILEEINEGRKDEEDPITIQNPADSVNSSRDSFLLNDAVGEGKTLSHVQVDLAEYIGQREYKEGDGLFENQKIPGGLLDEELIREYLFLYLGYYGVQKDNSLLQYQIEYLLAGKSCDYDNLESIAKKILMIRYAANVSFLFSNTKKQAEAEELALMITAGIMHPELKDAVKISILFAWAYAESMKDLRILFDGNKVARIKTEETFYTPLASLPAFRSHLGEYTITENGMNYKDYLQIFLFAAEKSKLSVRLMDLMEMDIRKTYGNHNFQMDHCIYQVEAEVNVSSSFGHAYQIIRRYSYE